MVERRFVTHFSRHSEGFTSTKTGEKKKIFSNSGEKDGWVVVECCNEHIEKRLWMFQKLIT